jgi:transposase InsO family protein
MSWKAVNVYEQRIRFVLRAIRGEENFSGLCREFEISRVTGYEWLKRYREGEGIEDLKDRSRRPHTSPRKTAETIEQRIVSERLQRPDWGARKFETILKRDGIEVPRGTIHRVFLRNGLIKPHHQHPPALKRFEREQPNQLWQMDFKGLPANLSQGWSPLSIVDDCSRYALALEALAKPNGGAVRQVLRGVFEEVGLPDAMLVDHGTPWWSAHQPCGWTQLSVWLMKQNVKIYLSAVRHPQTQGKVERFHRTIQDALHERGFPADREAWPGWLAAFRREYNEVRPHEALAMAVPASRWQPSGRCYVEQPEWEYPAGAELKKVRTSGQVTVGKHEYSVTAALAGEMVQLAPLEQDRLLVYYRRTCIREINLQKRQSYPVYFAKTQPVFAS